MGIALYMYADLETYIYKYKNFIDEKKAVNEASIKVLDLYIKDKDKLWVVLDTDLFSNKTGYTRSIAFFNLKEFNSYKKGDEKLVLDGKLHYNPKTNHISFFKKTLRKPELRLRIDKFNGEKPKKTLKIDYRNMFFDINYNRLLLILNNEDEVQLKFDFVLGEVEDLLKVTNFKLENIELLLESLLIPPDLIKYMKEKRDRMKKHKLVDDET